MFDLDGPPVDLSDVNLESLNNFDDARKYLELDAIREWRLGGRPKMVAPTVNILGLSSDNIALHIDLFAENPEFQAVIISGTINGTVSNRGAIYEAIRRCIDQHGKPVFVLAEPRNNLETRASGYDAHNDLRETGAVAVGLLNNHSSSLLNRVIAALYEKGLRGRELAEAVREVAAPEQRLQPEGPMHRPADLVREIQCTRKSVIAALERIHGIAL